MTEEMIDAVKRRTFLYDTGHHDYMRSKLKDFAWKTIAKEVNLKNGTEAKNEWARLRNCHRDALRRQKRYEKSGFAATSLKPWKFQKQMAFLLPYMGNKQRKGNLSAENDSDSQKEQDPAEPNDPIELPEPESFTRKRKKNIISWESAQMSDESAEKRRNPLRHFFNSMYEMTASMPPLAQHTVRNQIYAAVSSMEAQLLRGVQPETAFIESQHYTEHSVSILPHSPRPNSGLSTPSPVPSYESNNSSASSNSKPQIINIFNDCDEG